MKENIIFIAAQVVGFIGLSLSIISFQKKDRNGILTFQAMGSSLWIMHFLMLSGYTGAALNLLNVIRCVVYRNNKKWARSRLWMYFFCLVCVLICIFTWSNIFSIFPCVAMILTSISFYINNPKYVRFLTLPSSPLWIIYNFINKSFVGIAGELFVSTSIIIAIVRYDILKQKQE